MVIEFTKDELRDLVRDSYDLMLSIPSPKYNGNKYEIQSRSKLKNLPEALREFEEPTSAITHFVKSAAYFLPRSDTKGSFDELLEVLLAKVKKIQDNDSDPERVREKIRYLIGYSNWSMDAVCYIFTEASNDNEMKERLKNMVSAELSILDGDEYVDGIVDRILKWKPENNKRRD